MKQILLFLSLFLSISVIKAHTLKNDIEKANLSGTVIDTTKNEALQGASVYIPDLRLGAITDNNGNFQIKNIPKGSYVLQVTYIGYATYVQKISVESDKNIKIALSETAIEKDEVVVTGTSKATNLKLTPIPMSVVNSASINMHAASGNVIAEITNVPGVSAVSTGPNVSKPFIRGLGYNRVITAVNGMRIEGQQWGDEHGIEVDQNAIDKVEIIKGPASLTFGSGAMGGVVNLLTPPPVENGKILGTVSGTYGTNNGLINTSLKLQGNNKGFTWGTILSNKEAKNYQNKRDGRVYATNYKERDALVMLGLNKDWGFSHITASIFDDEQAIPDGSRDETTRQFTKQITEEDEERAIVSKKELNSYTLPNLRQHVQLYTLSNQNKFYIGEGSLQVNLGYQLSHRREFTHPTQTNLPGLNLKLGTLNYDVKYNTNIFASIETTIGVNGMYQANKLGKGTDFPIPAYHQFDFGGFLVMKKSFNKLHISAGARYDISNFRGQELYLDETDEIFPVPYEGTNANTVANVSKKFDKLHKDFDGFTGSIGASYEISNAFVIKGNIASGYRAPSVAELSAEGADPGSQIYHVGNKNFNPEKNIQTDFGVQLNLKNVSANLSIFNNEIHNYIFQQQMVDANGIPERVDANGNANPNGSYSKFTYVQTHARIYGGEANVDIHPWHWLHFKNTITLTYGNNLGKGNTVPDSLKYLPFIPPIHTHTELGFSLLKNTTHIRNFYAFAAYDHFAAQNRYFAAYGTETYTAGYNLLSAGIGASYLNKKGNKIFDLFIEGTNLANISYQSNMSRLKYFDNPEVPAGVQPGIFNMGRNISVKLIVPFGLGKK